jgi:hypothetical protein
MRQGIKIIGALGLVMVVIAGCNSTEQTLAPIPAMTPRLRLRSPARRAYWMRMQG